ncbi:MAG: cyclase [Roseofilum sp. SBFL]|uniref:SRPBCC family protein n=1 Tax=unclassified Roseofilum TaxID=2620099 RepID=UPI001B138F71|nr:MULTISPECIES: SRPBCC family protein [unclassified Roseofilum]MBP0014871.1 cyclase [Roseofilum sp. SID3]MBP0024624.1 cyclase [Roseofilum sp. SID2]MBP0036680.1 cyclase [Roseofilum sp. SID1]MBP0044643.1 cyclase [Roseofilum sp. SBFL]
MNQATAWIDRIAKACNTEPSASLGDGHISVKTEPWGLGGGSAIAQLYLPLSRQQCWQKVSNYSQWVNYFPDITYSQVLPKSQQLYQKGIKDFILLRVEVEIYLQIRETCNQAIEFELLKGSFSEFLAYLHLQDYQQGTLLSYAVQATPNFPIPAPFIEQALKIELPANMRHMRQVLCP